MSTIKPGRATDAAVARALGWSICDDHNCDGSCGCRLFRSDCGADGVWECATEDADGKQSPWSPSTVEADALAAMEATGRPWCAMKCGEEEKGWTTAAYIARITDPEMEWAEAPTLCLAASAAILAWAAAKGGK